MNSLGSIGNVTSWGLVGPSPSAGAAVAAAEPADSFTGTTTPQEVPVSGTGAAAPPIQAPWSKEQCPATLLGRGADGSWHMDGVRWGFDDPWQPRFSDASIRPDRVKDVYLVVEPFKPEWIAAHSFLLYTFEDDAPVRDAQGRTDSGLVVSVEARLREGQSYDLLKGMGKNFGLIYQLGTWSDAVQKDCGHQGHKLIRHRLDLTHEQKKELLEHSLDLAAQDRSKEYYNTLSHSCFTRLVDQVNSVLPKSQRIGEWIVPGRLHRVLTALPNLAPSIFAQHHLLTADPAVQTQPDARLHPEAQGGPSALQTWIREKSESRFWKPVLAAAGLVGGAAVGSLVGPPLVGAVVGGIAGLEAGRFTAANLARSSHVDLEPSEKWT